MNWIDTLPAIPLAVGLPVIVHWTDDEREQVIIACDERGGQSIVRGDPMPNGYSVTGDNDGFRVDLADPQGFGYALRYAGQHCDPSISYLWPAMASRWMRGETTDTDRLALAQAIADLVETKGGAA